MSNRINCEWLRCDQNCLQGARDFIRLYQHHQEACLSLWRATIGFLTAMSHSSRGKRLREKLWVPVRCGLGSGEQG